MRRGLRLLTTFDGRDDRGQFWPYCAAVLVAWMVVGNIAFVAAFILSSVTDSGDAGPGLFLALFANNVVYFAMMIALTVQLALPARREAAPAPP